MEADDNPILENFLGLILILLLLTKKSLSGHLALTLLPGLVSHAMWSIQDVGPGTGRFVWCAFDVGAWSTWSERAKSKVGVKF